MRNLILDKIALENLYYSTVPEFVVAGNQDRLEAFYAGRCQWPVLGLGWVKNKVSRLSREHPRYMLANVCQPVREVWKQVPAMFEVEVSDKTRGHHTGKRTMLASWRYI